jgi:hypothetical protein
MKAALACGHPQGDGAVSMGELKHSRSGWPVARSILCDGVAMLSGRRYRTYTGVQNVVAALILPLSTFAQGSAGTGGTSTGIGAPVGPAGPGIRSRG